jgi:hypothetical protein
VTRTLDAEVTVPAQCELAEGPFWEAAQPHAGDIFACTPGVTGRPPYLFGA